jgi:hypothetical protein
MNVIENILIKMFTDDTYSCIKGKGITKLVLKLQKVLKDKFNTDTVKTKTKKL